jgi:hypothetical protein
MELRLTASLVLGMTLLSVLVGVCYSRHEYPRVGNLFTGDTDMEQCQILSKWDLLVLNVNLQESRPEMLDSLRSLNPDIVLLCYFPAAGVWADYESSGRIGCGYGRKAEECDWWLYDTKGNRVGDPDYAFCTNFSTNCHPDQNGQTIDQWLAEYIRDEIYASGAWDGVMIDGCHETSWYLNNYERYFVDPPAMIDTDRDGVADDPDSLLLWWSTALESFLCRLRQEVGTSYVLVANGITNRFSDYLQGGIREDFPFMNGDWETNMFAPYGYITMCNEYLQEPMNYSYLLCQHNDDQHTLYEPHRTNSFERYLRWTLTSALLGDGYYFLHGSSTSLNGSSTNLWWEDYYDLDLGNPTSDLYLDSLWNSIYDRYSLVWRREFEKATVFCNPFSDYISFQDGAWLAPEDGRIKTHQVPSEVSVTIEARLSQLKFSQNDTFISYCITLTNTSEHAAYAHLWARLTSGGDTLVASKPMEYLVGAGKAVSKERYFRTPSWLGPGTYCLEVMVGGEAGVVVDRDSVLVTKVVEFEKEQIKDSDPSGQGGLTIEPRLVTGRGGDLVLEVKGSPGIDRYCWLRLYDVTGRLIGAIHEGQVSQGERLEIRLGTQAGGSLAPGVYFLSAEVGDQTSVKKIVLLR